MAYTALGRCASSGAVYAINPSFSVLNSNLLNVNCQNLLSTGLPKLLQQVVASLQMKSCHKPDFKRLLITWWNWDNRQVKLTTCNNSVVFVHSLLQLVEQVLTINVQQVCWQLPTDLSSLSCCNLAMQTHRDIDLSIKSVASRAAGP